MASRPCPQSCTLGSRDSTTELTSDERIAVLRSIAKECIHEDEFRLLLKKKAAPVCYVWFVPTPTMDIAQAILKTIYVNKMVKAGYMVKILIADWFAQRDYKIGNNKNKIRTISCYNIEIWKAAGMDIDRVVLVWLSDELERHAADYWSLALDVSQKYTLRRVVRYLLLCYFSCCTNSTPYGLQRLPAAEIFYTCMQVAVILCHKLQADIWLLSMDQQDIVMITKEYCEDIKRETKPTIMLHNMLPNLVDDPHLLLRDHYYFYNERDPKWNIFMHDRVEITQRKIRRAFCPPKVVFNPFLEYIKYVIFPWFGKFEVAQKEQMCSNKTFASMEELIVDYESGDLDPVDVKLAFEKGMFKILEHVRDCFNNIGEAQSLIIALEDHFLDKTVSADLKKIFLQNASISGARKHVLPKEE